MGVIPALEKARQDGGLSTRPAIRDLLHKLNYILRPDGVLALAQRVVASGARRGTQLHKGMAQEFGAMRENRCRAQAAAAATWQA